jgi:hypothetical protein
MSPTMNKYINPKNYSEQDFQMRILADNFLNLSFGNMDVYVHTAIAKNRIPSLASVLDQGFRNVRNANGNLS